MMLVRRARHIFTDGYPGSLDYILSSFVGLYCFFWHGFSVSMRCQKSKNRSLGKQVAANLHQLYP